MSRHLYKGQIRTFGAIGTPGHTFIGELSRRTEDR